MPLYDILLIYYFQPLAIIGNHQNRFFRRQDGWYFTNMVSSPTTSIFSHLITISSSLPKIPKHFSLPNVHLS